MVLNTSCSICWGGKLNETSRKSLSWDFPASKKEHGRLKVIESWIQTTSIHLCLFFLPVRRPLFFFAWSSPVGGSIGLGVCFEVLVLQHGHLRGPETASLPEGLERPSKGQTGFCCLRSSISCSFAFEKVTGSYGS